MYEDRNESDCSHGMDVNSDLAVDGTANGALKESMKTIQTGSEAATRDDSSTLKCKIKQSAEAHYLIESGKATNGDGQAESLEMKRKRQRLGIITCSLDSKDLKVSLKTAKMPSSTQSTERINGVEHHVKDSGKPVKLGGDSDGEQLSNMQLNSEKHYDAARDMAVLKAKNQQHSSGTFRENITPQPTTEQSATMLSEELKALECNIADILPGGESGKLCAKQSTGEPPSVPAISDGTGNVSELSMVGDTVPSLNESLLVYTKKPQLLGGNECTHQNGGNIGNCKLQVEEGSSEERDQNLLNKRHFKEKASSINPGKMGGIDELNAQHGIGTCSKSSLMHFLEDDPLIRPNVSPQHEPAKFRIDFFHQTEEETGQPSTQNLGDASNSLCLQNVDRKTANSKALPSFQNEKLISTTRNVTEGLIKDTGLNLNQKFSVIPRDSRGRFIRSAGMNREKEGELSYFRWKKADRHKPIKRSKNSVNTSAIHNETNFAMNAALSYARIGKFTPVQTYIPVCKDYPGGRESFSRHKSVPELNGVVAGQAAFSSLAITTLNHVEAPLSEKTIDLANFFIQRRCSDYGQIGLPLDSQGELIKYIPNTTDVDYDLYRIRNSTADKEPFVTECSKRLPGFNFVESTDASSNISEVGRLLKMPSDSALRNFKCPSQQNCSIPCKQADCCHRYSAFKTNQIKPDKAGLVQPSSLDELQMEYVGNSQVSTFGSSISKTGTSSTLNVCMPSTVESGYNGEGKQKSSVLEKTYPEVQSLRKERPTAQPVMRLMGHNFIIGSENKAGNTLKDYQQGSDNETPSTSEATLDLSSSDKSNTVHRGHYTTCKEGQLYFPYSEPNTLFQHSIRKENISECPQNNCKQMGCPETTSFACNTAEDLRILNSSVPKLVGKRFRTSCVPCEQSLRGQFYSEPTWTSTLPFYNPIANTLISPVNHLSSNTGANQGDKMAYKYPCNSITSELRQTELSRSGCNLHGNCFQNPPEHIRDSVRLHQNQVYSQNQSSSSVLHPIPKPVFSGCVPTSTIREATGNPGSLPIQSDALALLQYHSKCTSTLPQWLLNAQKQKEAIERTSYNEKQSRAPVPSSMKMESTKQLPCVNSSSVPFPDRLPAFTCVLAHPTYFQTASTSHCKTVASSASLTDPAASTMNGRYNSMDLVERENVKLPMNMRRNICAISHEKANIADTVDLESPENKCLSDRRTGTRKKSLQGTNGLHGKWLKHEGCTQGPSKNCDLFLTGQELHKRKGVFHHEINSSSLAAKLVKNREMSENDFLDGKGAEIWRINESSIKISIGEDSQDRENCSIKNKVNETFSNASLHSGVLQKCRENRGEFRKPKNNLMESQLGTSRVGLHGSSTEASLKLAEPMKLTGGAKHILKPPLQNGNAKQSLPVHYTLPFTETAAEGRERFGWCKQIQ
jgi:hypothetical protein